MYVHREGGETVTIKRTCKVDLRREKGTQCAQSGGGVGSAEWGRDGYTCVAGIRFPVTGDNPPPSLS